MIHFSVVIPLYNKANHIRATIESVLEQSFEDFEIIVVNDGSTDGSIDEVGKVEDERIKLYTIENNGVSHARNFGVEKACSEHIVFLDADDLWKPNHLENLKQLLEDFPHCGMYATGYELHYGKQSVSSHYHDIPENWQGVIPNFFDNSKINCIASSSSVMVPKNVFKALGGFDIRYNSGEDIDLWIRIALNYKVAFCAKVSAVINMNADNQVSQRSINTRTHLDFDNFKNEEAVNDPLKSYLDLNRFSMAIQHKLVGNTKIAEDYISKIDMANLNAKQRFLLKLNTSTLKKSLNIKSFLRKNGIVLSAFR